MFAELYIRSMIGREWMEDNEIYSKIRTLASGSYMDGAHFLSIASASRTVE